MQLIIYKELLEFLEPEPLRLSKPRQPTSNKSIIFDVDELEIKIFRFAKKEFDQESHLKTFCKLNECLIKARKLTVAFNNSNFRSRLLYSETKNTAVFVKKIRELLESLEENTLGVFILNGSPHLTCFEEMDIINSLNLQKKSLHSLELKFRSSPAQDFPNFSTNAFNQFSDLSNINISLSFSSGLNDCFFERLSALFRPKMCKLLLKILAPEFIISASTEEKFLSAFDQLNSLTAFKIKIMDSKSAICSEHYVFPRNQLAFEKALASVLKRNENLQSISSAFQEIFLSDSLLDAVADHRGRLVKTSWTFRKFYEHFRSEEIQQKFVRKIDKLQQLKEINLRFFSLYRFEPSFLFKSLAALRGTVKIRVSASLCFHTPFTDDLLLKNEDDALSNIEDGYSFPSEYKGEVVRGFCELFRQKLAKHENTLHCLTYVLKPNHHEVAFSYIGKKNYNKYKERRKRLEFNFAWTDFRVLTKFNSLHLFKPSQTLISINFKFLSIENSTGARLCCFLENSAKLKSIKIFIEQKSAQFKHQLVLKSALSKPNLVYLHIKSPESLLFEKQVLSRLPYLTYLKINSFLNFFFCKESMKRRAFLITGVALKKRLTSLKKKYRKEIRDEILSLFIK